MTKHHHLHPVGRKHKHLHEETSYELDWLLNLLKKIVQIEPDDRGVIKGDFSCQEARYFNQKINECRQESGYAKLLNEHEHHPEFTRQERSFAVKKITKEIRHNTSPFPIISQKPDEIIYGNAHNPEEQITYTFNAGKWLITPGKNVDALIIDPAGKVIEIKPGPHIHEYGSGGNLMVAGICKDHDEEHHHHDGPCTKACGHGARSHEHHHHQHGHHCSHHHH